ncbi:hypothetical protein [Streptomyces sp. NPDC017964]|uniref:hypothetical protein n=1 Tax=Streptomyces sp. NPDC017964 TaxID=3365022 RepID=UPI003789B62F
MTSSRTLKGRARRAKIAAEVDRELPGLTEGERRQVLEERLRERASIDAEDFARRHEQARTERARRDAQRAAAQEQAERIAQGLCPKHGTRPGRWGHCAACGLDGAIARPAPTVGQQRVPDGPPRRSCGDCGARIKQAGRALGDGLCKLCREEAASLAAERTPAATVSGTVDQICSGRDGAAACSREALPSRSVCARHRVQELAGEVS